MSNENQFPKWILILKSQEDFMRIIIMLIRLISNILLSANLNVKESQSTGFMFTVSFCYENIKVSMVNSKIRVYYYDTDMEY